MSILSALFLWSVILIGFQPAHAASPPQIRDIQIGYDGRGLTRVVIFASENLDYRSSAFGDDGHGIRYVLDFDRLEWALPDSNRSKGEGAGVGEIYRYRYAHFSPTVSRLVFDLDRPLVVVSASSDPPDRAGGSWRLIIDYRATDEATFNSLKPNVLGKPATQTAPVRSTGPQSILPQPSASPLIPEAIRTPTRPVIVIDAGHGGRDPGASGRKGAREKDITLQAAVKLQSLLLASGQYEVIMTRTTDVFVEHDERVRIAREAEADLFISIHADAAGNRTVQGASVYTLDEKGDARLETKLKEASWGVPLEVHSEFEAEPPSEAVEDILVDFTTRETQNNSAEFAELLIPELAKAGPVLRNTHRQANYYVLLSPNVPAVLLEMGFLTNINDETRLLSASGVDRSMAAVKSGIDVYFERQKKKSERYSF